MRNLCVAQPVSLVRDIPDLSLHSGDVGMLYSRWVAPSPAYEVEFQIPGYSFKTRTLILGEQVELAKSNESKPRRTSKRRKRSNV